MPYQIILFVALLASPFVTYGYMAVKLERAAIAAYGKGVTAGKEQAAAAVTEAARNTSSRVDQGEREAPAVSADRKKIEELCAKSASCRDRHKIKGGA